MALEADLNTLLKTVFARVYPDIAPDPLPARPYCTYQQVGGESVTFVDRTLPGLRNARMQINVWSNTRLEAATLARQVEDALRLATVFQVQPMGALVSDYEPDLKLYGTRQDFSVFSI